MLRRALICAASAALAGLVLSPSGPADAQTGQEKQILGMTEADWVAFRDFNGQQLLYFTHLEAWRCGIGAVRYSLNSDALDRQWRLQPCDPANPNAVTTERPYIALPPGSVSYALVQLTFSDGTLSNVVRFTP